ncbi:tripartite motif-containing protein 16-like isoform X2 [Triplophysa dalaica]|uniref:tripartite motif-containing protein 16-like isoform X2 n=1 Tax=Triplophysa dalaica TaxID=1582913 RepID=UPI0024DF9098|nr:tripartite motif-containing protein 16-like isoform X2 [Triplophysa dalaica]
MAEGNISHDKFSCSVCLDLLKDPVTIPCGHSYCMSCITNYWNQEDQKRIYSCPQCRQTFTSRPALNKNVMITEMVEELKTRLQTDVSDQCYAGPEDVKCDVCTERKYKAVKSCLECLNSYCQNHLQQHEQFFHVNKHNLMDPTRRLNEMICSKHRKHLEIYCRTDQECICYPCLMDEHKDHDTVAAVTERTEKQKVLGEKQRNFKQRIQEREKKHQELRETVNSYKTAVEYSERIFTELIRSIERRRSEVTQLIRDQEKTAVSRAEGVLKCLEQEIEDLRRREPELEQLLNTDNHIHFLKSFQCLSAPPESTVSHNITVSSLVSFDDVRKSVSQLKEKLVDFCRDEIKKISGGVSYITVVPDEPLSEEFLQYFRQLTLDLNTVNEYIRLSDGNTTATNTNVVQQYPDHPDRFRGYLQVLCRESVCERCYWEVEWSGGIYISVSYKSISRKGWGNECLFGRNDQSWSLLCSDSTCCFIHNNKHTYFPVVSSSCRIGVFVDHRSGILSFYSVSDTMTLIHRVKTTFTQPLYPGFTVCDKSTVKVCRLTKS